MSSESPLEISLRDPLSEVTRKERKMLLGISILSIFIVKTGLVPSNISAFGIDFDKANQQAFQIVIAFVVVYFLVAFILYGLSDFLAWRISFNEGSKITYQAFFDKISRGKIAKTDDAHKNYPSEWISKWPNHLAFPVSCLRALCCVLA